MSKPIDVLVVSAFGLSLWGCAEPVGEKKIGAALDPLAYTRVEVPAHENGWHELSTIDYNPTEDEYKLTSNTKPAELRNPSVAGRIADEIQVRASALQQLENGLSKPRLQVPEFDIAKDSQGYSELARLKRIADLVRLRGIKASLEGDAKVAIDSFKLSLTLGQKLQDADRSVLFYLVGVAIEIRALSGIGRAAAAGVLNPDVVLGVIQVVESAPDPFIGYSNSIRVEYQANAKVIHAIPFRSYETPEQVPTTIPPGEHPLAINLEQFIARVLAGHSDPFDREDAVRAARLVYTETLNAARRPWPEPRNAAAQALKGIDFGLPYELLEMRLPARAGDAKYESEVRQQIVAKPNPYGRYLVRMLLATTASDASATPFRIMCWRKATIALLKARMSGGKLSDKDIPIDPFSGRPMRYFAERGILYSVGPDGQDDGGIEKPKLPRGSGDYVFAL